MVQDLALQRNKYKHLSDDEWRWFLQQVEGRERTADKLPSFAAIEDWWYPVRLSCEQCSSELAARYKASLVSGDRMVDLTGGYGVDTYFMSEQFQHTDYVEQNSELCRIAEHNFNIQRDKGQSTKGHITVHNYTAEDFLTSHLSPFTFHLIYLDPARRDSHGGKVFKLADCTPNVIELLPTLMDHLAPDGQIMLKLSPMLDLTQAFKELSLVHGPSLLSLLSWGIHIVAVKNEVKEVLLLSRYTDISKYRDAEPTITAIDLSCPEQAFAFTREEEKEAQPQMVNGTLSLGTWIYEPNAAILKAGAYKLVGERFGLHKLDINTHLYTSETLVENFPGRVWKIQEQLPNHKLQITNANVLVRNYPLTAEQLKKRLHLRDGGTEYIIGCRVNGKPTVLLAERCH